MPFDNDTPKSVPLKKLPKRYGWHRRYNDDDMKPKWRLVAARASARLVEVLGIKNALNDAAAKTRKRGFVGEFDIHECAVGLDIAPDTVASVFRVLVDMQWISRDHVIVEWLDQQPELEDTTAAARQRNKRRRDEALTRAAIGMASAEDLELLSKPEQEALAKLAGMSRVTAEPPPAPAAERIAPFKPITPKENSYGAVQIAHRENVVAARAWLLGDGLSLVGYGPASKIVADNIGCNRMNADGAIRGFLQDLDDDTVILATIISAAEQQALTGDAFRKVVEQRIAEIVRERTNGPTFPFGIAAQNGGRRT